MNISSDSPVCCLKSWILFSMASLLLPPEEDSAAIQHSNPQRCKWPVQDNWKGIWAITGILISDSSRKELNSFLLVLLGLMFDRKWVWGVQEQVTELALLPAALPTLTVCLQKSDTFAYYWSLFSEKSYFQSQVLPDVLLAYCILASRNSSPLTLVMT